MGDTNTDLMQQSNSSANAPPVSVQQPEIFAIEDTTVADGKKPKYRGRTSVLTGAIALIVMLLGGIAALCYFGYDLYQHTQDVINNTANGNSIRKQMLTRGVRILDNTRSFPSIALDAENPEKYANRHCVQPQYVVKGNMIHVDYQNGNVEPFLIKGVSWTGMENVNGAPEGLSNGDKQGNNLFQIANFLARNNFNSVRIPVSVESITRNIHPNPDIINAYSHSALDLQSYRSLLSTFIQGLGSQSLSVLIDFHTLSPKDPGELWYNDAIRINDIADAIALLGEELCNSVHWNIIGIDLKNAPNKGTWGDRSKTDWAEAAKSLGNSVVKACPNWLVFVQGIKAKHSFQFESDTSSYRDFDGAGLQNAKSKPIQLSVPNKLVYAPQFYTPSEKPLFQFYEGGDPAGLLVNNYVERDDESLKKVTYALMKDMFGFLSEGSQNAIVLSAFGGIYGEEDEHPKKTSTRVYDYIIENFVNQTVKLSGGYLWALNPTTSFEYNPANIADNFEFGLVDKTWRKGNLPVLDGLLVMDEANDIGKLKCVKE